MSPDRIPAVLCTAATLTMACAGLTPAAADIRLHGSSSVAKSVIQPAQAQLEARIGGKLEVVANGSGNGLQDLVAGRADVAMISAPLEAEAKIVNATAPGTLDTGRLKVFTVGSSTISFIVHPSNPVRTLSQAQMQGILTGKTQNWSQVGGADAPIVLGCEKPGNGTRASVEVLFLNGESLAATCRVVPALAQIAQMVAQLPTAIGYGNASSIEAGKVAVLPGLSVAQPLALVTRGEPGKDAQALIQATREIAASK